MTSIRSVGLDIHANETTGVVLDAASGEVAVRRIAGRPQEALAWLETIPTPYVAVYEAGPTGYGLARAAAERGLDVRVCAPGHVARRAGDRIKTDRRDALRHARLLSAGELTQVRVPTPAEEQLRDLVRAREHVRIDLMRQDARAIAIAWRAQRRLYGRWQALEATRGKPGQLVAVAVARELACYVWEIASLD